MNQITIPYLLEPLTLESLLSHENLLVVDVGSHQTYLQQHVPGAVHLDYSHLILGQPPAPGLVPPMEKLQSALRGIGLTYAKHVVAYDDQGNGRASRLLWTLELIGHQHASLLDGGLPAWVNAGHTTASAADRADEGVCTSDLTVELNPSVLADKQYVLASLMDEQIMLLDARSPDEYNGLRTPSLRNGRIPGAVNLNWLDAIDQHNNLRFKPATTLNAMLAQLNVTREKEIVVYCQTHHRSSHSFVMLRHLGFDKVRGYAGAWSEWGNAPDMPIE